MARPPLPTARLKLSGTFDTHKSRYADRENELKPTGAFGGPPKYMTTGQKAVWREVKKALPDGVLTFADRFTVELVCRLVDRMRTGELTSGEAAQLITALAKLGMTPADRSKVQMDPKAAKPKQDEWSLLHSKGNQLRATGDQRPSVGLQVDTPSVQ